MQLKVFKNIKLAKRGFFFNLSKVKKNKIGVKWCFYFFVLFFFSMLNFI